MLSWMIEAEEGIVLRLKIKPSASKNQWKGLVEDTYGQRLQLSLSAPPIDGQANKALIMFLKSELKSFKGTQVEFLKGSTNAFKECLIRVDSKQMKALKDFLNKKCL